MGHCHSLPDRPSFLLLLSHVVSLNSKVLHMHAKRRLQSETLVRLCNIASASASWSASWRAPLQRLRDALRARPVGARVQGHLEGLEARLELRAYFTRGRERGGAQPGSQAVAWREGTLAPASPTPRWNFATLAESRRISPDLATSFAEQPVPPDGREVEGDGPRLLSGTLG